MSNVLLVEPDYRSKFPPLGLMKLSTYHKTEGDRVTFVRGRDPDLRSVNWHRIYVSSLFTWELPRTLRTIKYYRTAIDNPKDIFVGGTGVTLLPQYIRDQTDVTVIEGQLDRPNMLGMGSKAVAKLTPDYSIIDDIPNYEYFPADAYFTRITRGCIRSCKFCSVPILEREFGFFKNLRKQIEEVDTRYGERQNLVIMDNNILGIDRIAAVFQDIAKAGFEAGAKRNGRQRWVDFNQGLDARLISKDPSLAEGLASICTSPVRLAFDFVGMERPYRNAVKILTQHGFTEFTNYMLFNFKDTPEELYHRIWINAELNLELGIRITGFPMRFVPMDDIRRGHVAEQWKWRYLRGIQCILLATRGLISPNPEFIRAAFGESVDKFFEILAMPDRYIIYRQEYKSNGADEWRRLFRRLRPHKKGEFLRLLEDLNRNHRQRKQRIAGINGLFAKLLEHYYPNGDSPPRTPKEDNLLQQGVSVGQVSRPGAFGQICQ
mgnify:CR=1 FL=1